MSHLNSLVRRVLLEQGGEPQEPSFWREVGKTIMGPEDEPSFAREVVKTVQRAVQAAPSTLKGWVDNAPQVMAFILSPAGLRAAVMKGTLDAFLGAPANAPGTKDPVFERSVWTLNQIHTILQTAGAGLDPADIVDGLLYFIEAAAEDDDRAKESLLNNGAVSMVAAIPAFGATLAARGVVNGAQITEAHVRQISNALDTPEAASLMGRQGVDDAKQAVQELRAQEQIEHVADTARQQYAQRIVDQSEGVSRQKIVADPGQAGAGIKAEPEPGVAQTPTQRADSRLRGLGMSDEQVAHSRGVNSTLAQSGMSTVGFQFKNSAGRDATIITGPDGVKRAYYLSTGTGSQTSKGTWVPYRGQSLEFLDSGAIGQHVVKYSNATKIPPPSSGADRAVFDAVNRPQVADQLKSMAKVAGFEAGDTNWSTETLGNFAYRVDQIGRENAQLVRSGIDIGGGDIEKVSQFLLPWPHDVPVPPKLVGQVVTPNDIMDGLRWTETDARGNRVTRTYREWHASRESSEMMKPIGQTQAMSNFAFRRSGSSSVIMSRDHAQFLRSIGR